MARLSRTYRFALSFTVTTTMQRTMYYSWLLLFCLSFARVAVLAAYFLPQTIQPATYSNSYSYNIAEPSLCHAMEILDSQQQQQCEIIKFANPDASHPNLVPILNIKFPPSLTQRQFRNLQRLYGNCGGRSLSSYKPNTSYEILDFLSPMVQATWGHRFRNEDELGPAPLFHQCYGFLLDVLMQKKVLEQQRRRQRRRWYRPWAWFRRPLPTAMAAAANLYPTLSTPDSRAVYQALLETTSLVSNDFSSSNKNNYAQPDGIQPGDLILIYHDNSNKFESYKVWLDHLVMYVDGGLLLEKSGSGEGTTFRLVDYETFDQSWGIGVFRLQVRRPITTAKNKKQAMIDVAEDLTLGGKFSLPIVNQLALEGKLVKPLPGMNGGDHPKELCGAYDEDSERVLYTQVIATKHALIWNETTNRAMLPPDFFQPFLLTSTTTTTTTDVGADDSTNNTSSPTTMTTTMEPNTGRHENTLDNSDFFLLRNLSHLCVSH
jgi:hypothetical protein